MKTNQKGSVAPLVVAVVLLLLAAGAYYMWQKNQPMPPGFPRQDTNIGVVNVNDNGSFKNNPHNSVPSDTISSSTTNISNTQNPITWKTFTETNFTIDYPVNWNAGKNTKIGDYQLIFCPPEWSDPDPKIICKAKNNNDPHSATFAPIVLTVYEKYAPPDMSGNMYVWKGHEVGFALELLNESYRDVYEKMIDSFKSPLISTTETRPIINSITPSSFPLGLIADGATVDIKGQNFSGFEGDKNAFIENSSGQKGVIRGTSDSTNNLIRFNLEYKYCTIDTSYSGLPCPSYLNIVPGTYSIYVIPWGKKSNTVKFTIY